MCPGTDFNCVCVWTREERETQVYWRHDTYNNMFLGEGYQGSGSLSHIWNNIGKERGKEEEERDRIYALVFNEG